MRVQFNPRPRVSIVLRRDVTISENREHQTIYRPCRNQLSLSLSRLQSLASQRVVVCRRTDPQLDAALCHFASLASCFSRLYNSHTLHGRISTSATSAAAADRAFALYSRPHRADQILFILLRAKVYLKDLPRHQLHGPCRAQSL